MSPSRTVAGSVRRRFWHVCRGRRRSTCAAQAKPPSSDIRILPIRGNIYLLSGAGANIVASVGKDGVLLVDTGSAQMADKVLATVRDLSRW